MKPKLSPTQHSLVHRGQREVKGNKLTALLLTHLERVA